MAPFPSPTATWHSTSYPTLSPDRPALSAKGKVVAITGGGTGIGAETARQFAQAGATRIALLGRREQPLLDTKANIERRFPGTSVFTASTDITARHQVEEAFASFAGSSQIDVLISNAAKTGPHDAVEDVEPHAFLEAIQTNISGALNVAQAFLRHAAKDAVVVEVNSSAAHVNFGAGFASYSVAKMAVYRLWDSVSVSRPEIRIYHIQPGVVDTDMNKEAGGVAALGFEDHVSLPAGLNLWLASTEARFLKNKFIWSNWDVDELKSKAEQLESSTELNITLGGWPFNDSMSFKAKDIRER